MNSERNIVKKLYESKDIDIDVNDEELEEASFEANGSVYKCAFGKYSKDGEPISREDYFKAKDGGSVGGSKPKTQSKSTTSKPYPSTGLDFDTDLEDATYFDDPMGGLDDHEKAEVFGSLKNFNSIMKELGEDPYNTYYAADWSDSYKAIDKAVSGKKPTGIIKSTNKEFKDFEVYDFDDYKIVKDTNGPGSYLFSEKPKDKSNKTANKTTNKQIEKSKPDEATRWIYDMSKKIGNDQFVKDLEKQYDFS